MIIEVFTRKTGKDFAKVKLEGEKKNSWHDCSTAVATIHQQSLAQFLNSHWHNSSTVTDTILQKSLARLFNSHWHDCSTVTDTIVQQSLA